jgi:hypothetical protein
MKLKTLTTALKSEAMVRSNAKYEVGFLNNHRRMNVAVTRTRRQCCIICNTETVISDKFLKRLVEYFEKHAELQLYECCESNTELNIMLPGVSSIQLLKF